MKAKYIRLLNGIIYKSQTGMGVFLKAASNKDIVTFLWRRAESLEKDGGSSPL